MCHMNGIERDPDIDALFLTDKKGVNGPIRELHALIAIAQRPGENIYSHAPHMPKFRLLEIVPKGVIGGSWNAGIEVHPFEIPALRAAKRLCQAMDIIIRVVVTEGLFS